MDNRAKPASPTTDLPARIGHYEIKTLIGRGGMGDVYLAQHPLLGKRAALKVLKPELCRIPEQVARFQQEAMAVCRIGHPSIVDVFDFGTLPDGRVYYLMEHLEGRNLADILDLKGTLSPFEALDILAPVAEGLEAAHRLGIVHRDVKPENIFIKDFQGKRMVKVLDFGIAKLLDNEDSLLASGTRTGMILGTPAYMAPEQAAGKNNRISPATDIYALGVVLYHMLTGHPPFVADSQIEVLMHHLKTPAPALTIPGDSRSSQALDPVLQKALAKSPSDRYQTMSEFLAGLKRAIHIDAAPPLLHPSKQGVSMEGQGNSSGHVSNPALGPRPAVDKSHWPATHPGAAAGPVPDISTRPGVSLQANDGQDVFELAHSPTMASGADIDSRAVFPESGAIDPTNETRPSRRSRRSMVGVALTMLVIGAVAAAAVLSIHMIGNADDKAGQAGDKTQATKVGRAHPGPDPAQTKSITAALNPPRNKDASKKDTGVTAAARTTPRQTRSQSTQAANRKTRQGARIRQHDRTRTRPDGPARQDQHRTTTPKRHIAAARNLGKPSTGRSISAGPLPGKTSARSNSAPGKLSFSELASIHRPKKMTKLEWLRRRQILLHLADRAARTGRHGKAARWYFAFANEYHNPNVLRSALSAACRAHDRGLADKIWKRIKNFFTARELSREVRTCKKNSISLQ